MADPNVSGGDRLEGYLAGMEEKASHDPILKVGFLEGASYPDGMPVAAIAAINEYGARIEREPSEITVYRKLNKSGTEFLRNGRFIKRTQANFSSTHYVGAYVIKIPPRPFFRGMIAEKSPEWGNDFAKVLKATNYDISRTMELMGMRIKGQLQQAIIDFKDPPNAPSTIRAKGFDDPLIHTSHMLNSADYEVTEK